MLDSDAEGPGFKSQPRRCWVTVLGKLLTPIVPRAAPSPYNAITKLFLGLVSSLPGVPSSRRRLVGDGGTRALSLWWRAISAASLFLPHAARQTPGRDGGRGDLTNHGEEASKRASRRARRIVRAPAPACALLVMLRGPIHLEYSRRVDQRWARAPVSVNSHESLIARGSRPRPTDVPCLHPSVRVDSLS